MTIKYIEKENLVLVTTTEDLDHDRLVDLIRKSIVFADQHKCPRILFDHSKSKLSAGIFDIYDIAKRLGDFGISRDHRVGIVYNANKDKYEFADTVVHNWAGGYIRFFDDFEKAIKWL